MKPTRSLLQDLRLHIERIDQVAAAGEETFYQSFMHQDAIIRNYEVIGEIVKRLPADLLEGRGEVNWLQIKGFRDFLAHNYDRIELVVVWGAVQALPALRAAVEAMLTILPEEDEGEG